MTSILIVLPNLTLAGMEGQLVSLLKQLNPVEFQIELALFRDFPCSLRNEIPTHVHVTDLKKGGKFDLGFYSRLFHLIRNTSCQIITGKISGVNELLMLICGGLKRDGLILEIQSTQAVIAPYYRLMKLGFRIFKRRKWMVFCNSQKAVKELRSYVPSSIPITYVGNGVDLTKFHRILSTPHTSKFCIGFVGRIIDLKNLEVLLKAVHHLKEPGGMLDLRVLMIGRQADTHYFKTLMELVSALGLKDDVQFLDHTDDVANYYNQMDLFVLPSRVEGTPNVLLEAMACERVCLVSQGANTDHFVEAEFEFDTHDPLNLAEKIQRVKALSLSDRERIGRRNLEFVSQKYAIPIWVDRYQTAWRSAAEALS